MFLYRANVLKVWSQSNTEKAIYIFTLHQECAQVYIVNDDNICVVRFFCVIFHNKRRYRVMCSIIYTDKSSHIKKTNHSFVIIIKCVFRIYLDLNKPA